MCKTAEVPWFWHFVIVKLYVYSMLELTLLIVFIDKYIHGDLEVGFVESSSSMLVQERNPRIRSPKV